MSYRNVLSFRQLGLGAEVSASASASAAVSVSSECKAAADSFSKAAKYFGLTSDAVNKTVAQCCQGVKDSTLDTEGRAKLLLECFARAAATAGASAACLTAGVTAPFAGVCGTVGAFIADRVMGYDAQQLGVGTAAAIVCTAASGGSAGAGCFYAAAEVVGFVSDTLGPIIESIFDPGAKARREYARRRADLSLYNASADAVRDAEAAAAEQWHDSVNRIWDLFEEAFPSQYRSLASSKLGFTNTYSSLATAFQNAGVPLHTMPSEELATHNQGTYAACEIYGRMVKGTYGPLSPLCPPFIANEFYARLTDINGNAAKEAANELLGVVNAFFTALPLAEAGLAARIAVVAIAVKQQQALDEAAQASRANLATKVVSAAGVAVAAADAALKGNAKEGRAAVARAKNRYDMALAAYNLLLDSYGKRTTAAEAAVVAMTCAKDADCKRAAAGVERAKAAAELAVKNAASATTKRYLIGTGAAAAVAGGVYLFLKKK